jgi:uncharacterized membrane protein
VSQPNLEEKLKAFDSKKLIKWLSWILTAASMAIAVVFWLYFTNFSGGLSNKNDVWGTFGDFIGGTLNPILSFFALIALLLTIILQSRELEATREELKRSASAHEKQVNYISGQQQRDDLIRLVTKLTDRINNNYNSNLLDNSLSIHAALIGSDSPMDNDDLYNLIEQMRDNESKTYKIIKYLEADLFTLFEILEKYESVSNAVSDIPSPYKAFYLKEYQELITRFVSYGWFNNKLNELYNN